MKRKILIVEDEVITAMALENSLRKAGYEVIGPYSVGEGALAVAAIQRPDLALMDIRLLGLTSGISTALELRQRYNIPSIFLTGQDTPQMREAAALSKPLAYLLKPYTDQQLHQTIADALAML